MRLTRRSGWPVSAIRTAAILWNTQKSTPNRVNLWIRKKKTKISMIIMIILKKKNKKILIMERKEF